MEQTDTDGIKEIVAKDSWTEEDYSALVKLLSTGGAALPDRFKAILGEMEADNPQAQGAVALKIGIARYVLCRFESALEVLAKGTDNKDRRYFQAMCHKQLRQYNSAIEELQRAREKGWDPVAIDLAVVEVRALSGELDQAAKDLAKLENKAGETADFLYVRGLIDELNGMGDSACEVYIKAREIEPAHVAATFRLAYYYDLHGEEQQAIELYKECVSRPPVNANVLMNLAVLYEDAGDYHAAEQCLRRVLGNNQNHVRAKLFLKDVEACKTMYFDEDQAKRMAKRNAVLDIPVTDFELSVRARNCLKKMNIKCLGDLIMTTEAELLAYKNFGETSLREIREMVKAKGLRLGQGLEETGMAYRPTSTEEHKADNEGLLATPLTRVNFSIRARKAIEDLKIETLGELSKKSEAELLACKNFGQSSLNEIRQRLAEYGLRLQEPG